ncbi:MAG: arginine--tRNA ligase [Candidatus Bathyarchaeota archaeon]|nr:arginine--tRNA ligase [Candidatus Bathyarchaeota archaeon]MDH5787564.1 arginine--tRNA ligase [Candidatus Bathyarchaeota archaeon]
MVSENPFAALQTEVQNVLEKALKKAFPAILVRDLALEKPPNPEFGQLASSLCFELAKQIGEKPIALAKRIVKAVNKSEFSLIETAAPAGSGYINFHANFARFSALTINSASQLGTEYGFIKVAKPLKIIVEHTSANPLHPLHIGQARNPMLGDALARMFKARGHEVFRHYYIDDVGRQTSVITYGYEKLGQPKPEGKPDHFLGKIYTITSCLVEINRLKKELERAKALKADEEVTKINRELDDWVSVAAELKDRFPELFENLLEKISKDKNPEDAINKLNRGYEEGNAKAKRLIRKVSELCLQGFKDTLSRVDVFYDSWDWESDLVWSNRVAEVLQRLKTMPYVFSLGGVLEFDAEKVLRELDLRKKLGLKEDHEVSPLTLVRADGTTLYTTRDIAYTLWKFEKADRLVNVIGMEQTLAQLQLKIALHALGYGKHADNFFHFAYNLVTLPGYKMSSRRGRFITFDEVMDEAVKRAYEEVSKRSPQLSEKEKQEIADFVGIGAVRYALVEVDPSKPVEFTWDRVLNFEKNSAPYIQYTHARACSILRKAARKPKKPAYELLGEKLEHEIILALAIFPDTFIEASEFLKPSLIADFANAVSDKFNTFYNALPVIKAEPQGLSDARLALTDAVRLVLRNALNLIGIFAPEKM